MNHEIILSIVAIVVGVVTVESCSSGREPWLRGRRLVAFTLVLVVACAATGGIVWMRMSRACRSTGSTSQQLEPREDAIDMFCERLTLELRRFARSQQDAVFRRVHPWHTEQVRVWFSLAIEIDDATPLCLPDVAPGCFAGLLMKSEYADVKPALDAAIHAFDTRAHSCPREQRSSATASPAPEHGELGSLVGPVRP